MVQRNHSVFQVCGITPSKPPRMAHGLGKFLYTTAQEDFPGSQGRSCSSHGFWVRDGGIDEAAEEASAQKKRVSLHRQAAVTVEAAKDYARRFESGVNELSSLSNDQVGEELAQSGVNVMCKMCFSGESQGSERARRMLSCKICGKKYNKNCICFIGVHGVVTRAVFVRSVEFIPNGLLQDCKSLQNLSLHNNPISMDEFRLMEGLDLEDCPEKEPLGHGFYADFTMATRITIPDFITETIGYILQ
ncbi:hypothetical protein YC2023_076397 [Brassica napus]